MFPTKYKPRSESVFPTLNTSVLSHNSIMKPSPEVFLGIIQI